MSPGLGGVRACASGGRAAAPSAATAHWAVRECSAPQCSQVPWRQEGCWMCRTQDSKQLAWVYLLVYCLFHPWSFSMLTPLWHPIPCGGPPQITGSLNPWFCGVPTGLARLHCLCRLLQPRHAPVVAGEPAALPCPCALRWPLDRKCLLSHGSLPASRWARTQRVS